MNNKATSIEQIVLRRVVRIHALRPIVSGTTFSVLALAVAIWDISREVWVARVLENAPAHFSDIPIFYLSAFVNTDLNVQFFSLLTLITLVYLAHKTSTVVTGALIPVRG